MLFGGGFRVSGVGLGLKCTGLDPVCLLGVEVE